MRHLSTLAAPGVEGLIMDAVLGIFRADKVGFGAASNRDSDVMTCRQHEDSMTTHAV